LYTSSIRSNGNASALDPETLLQEVTFRILCSGERIGAVIGRGGCIVKALQNETGATICIGPPVVDCEDRLITITALENHESRFSPAQKAVVLVFCRSVESFVENVQDVRSYKESSVTARLVVPSNQVGVLLGKGGAIVSEMRKATWTSIRITGNGQVPKCASRNDQVVQISGDFPNVQDALYNATSRLRDHLFGITQNGDGTGPNGRLRDYGTNDHGLNIHSLSQSIDHLTLSRNSDRSSSPGVGAPKVFLFLF
jgi:poly(rC)-binding protein 2/3/4